MKWLLWWVKKGPGDWGLLDEAIESADMLTDGLGDAGSGAAIERRRVI